MDCRVKLGNDGVMARGVPYSHLFSSGVLLPRASERSPDGAKRNPGQCYPGFRWRFIRATG